MVGWVGGKQVENHATSWSNLQDCKISSRVEIPKLDPSVAKKYCNVEYVQFRVCFVNVQVVKKMHTQRMRMLCLLYSSCGILFPVWTGDNIATLGATLDSQLSWESGKFQLGRWSHGVVLLGRGATSIIRSVCPTGWLAVRLGRLKSELWLAFQWSMKKYLNELGKKLNYWYIIK